MQEESSLYVTKSVCNLILDPRDSDDNMLRSVCRVEGVASSNR